MTQKPGTVEDLRHMKRALELARRGTGRVSPNPLVGAVVVRDGKIVGEGYHLYERRDHAETVAIREAGKRARGATLYINLEPCCHQGRTPPCAEMVVAAGVARAVVAMRDPNPLVSGRGLAALEAAGMVVEEGLCAKEARKLNEKFCHFIQTGRPFLLLKLALSLDGRIATGAGESKWITGPSARRLVHRLRYEYDAVLVGINTLLRDDPRLDIRGPRTKTLTRVVLDAKLRTPANARIFESPDPVIIFHGPEAPAAKLEALAQRAHFGCIAEHGGQIDWDCLLAALASRSLTSVMVEGGGRVAASALQAGAVQKVNLFYAPKLIGAEGVPGIGALGLRLLADAQPLDRLRIRRLPPDYLIEGYCRPAAEHPVRYPE
jgi:diaminohydroxyphosphoribosylaminopyrimidine deaminase / 5-amino-6-(5-phosphoribosylamino)uracil reductase